MKGREAPGFVKIPKLDHGLVKGVDKFSRG
jgi:hypothetical protein